MIPFNGKSHLTLGVEIELQLINPDTLDLKPIAVELFKRTTATQKIKPEIFQSMAEINTGICANVQEVERDLRETMEIFNAVASELGALVATTGTHPFARYADRKLYDNERNHMLIDRNQWIARRIMIFGLHVHLGMRDGDTCMRFNNFFLHMIPHLIALSASSPFWQGDETGLASCRSTIFESCPTAGHPYRMKNWKEFSDLCENLVKAKAITSHKDLWWDIRPSPDFGTLEIRVCDGPATLSETLALVSLIHSLAQWYEEHGDYDTEFRAPFMWMIRENKWRAARHGLDAEIIVSKDAELLPLREEISAWMREIGQISTRFGYGPYLKTLDAILANGTSQERQRRIFEKTGSLIEVARFNTQEYAQEQPIF